MNLEAVWPYFALMAVVMGLAQLPLFRFLDDAPEQGQRYSTIDGLRGFLALGVFVFHLVVTHRFIESGGWDVPQSRFYVLLGPIGVSLFFMITGFLFWGKLLRAKGRPPWGALYIGRLFRIGPLYLAVVAVMLYIVAARTGFELREPGIAVAGSVLQWLALGLLDTQPDVNGYAALHVVAGVTWTLWYEWAFYISLMALAVFARGRTHLLFAVAAFGLCLAGKILWHGDAVGFAALFAGGMTVASLLHNKAGSPLFDTLYSVIALACLLALFAVSRGGYGPGAALLLAIFLYCVCSGATLFGLLNTLSAQRLGKISYSLYLTHGLVLTVVFAMEPIRTFAMNSVAAYWAIGIVCGALLLGVASLSYILVEAPGIELGKRLVRWRVRRRIAVQLPQSVTSGGDVTRISTSAEPPTAR